MKLKARSVVDGYNLIDLDTNQILMASTDYKQVYKNYIAEVGDSQVGKSFYLVQNNKLVKTDYTKKREYNDIYIFKTPEGKFDVYYMFEDKIELMIKDSDYDMDKSYEVKDVASSKGTKFIVFRNYENDKTSVFNTQTKKYVFEKIDYYYAEPLFDDFGRRRDVPEDLEECFLIRKSTAGKNLILNNKILFTNSLKDIDPIFITKNKVYLECYTTGGTFLYDLTKQKEVTNLAPGDFKVIREDGEDKYIVRGNAMGDNNVVLDENMREVYTTKFFKYIDNNNISILTFADNKSVIYRNGFKEKVLEDNQIVFAKAITQNAPQYFVYQTVNKTVVCNPNGTRLSEKNFTKNFYEENIFIFVDKSNSKPVYFEPTKLYFKEFVPNELLYSQMNFVLQNCILNKQEIIDLISKVALSSIGNKKSDLNAVIKNLYACQMITEQEYEEIRNYVRDQTLILGETKFRDYDFTKNLPKKDIYNLISKITDKSLLKQFIKSKDVLSSQLFDIWR